MRIDYDAINDAYLARLERDERAMIGQLVEAMNDGDVEQCRIRTVWEICNVCDGEGGHSRHLGVIDHETLDEWDDEQFEWYKSGVYDRTCDRCGGSGKVREVDYDSMPDDVRNWIDRYYADSREAADIQRMERMMGA